MDDQPLGWMAQKVDELKRQWERFVQVLAEEEANLSRDDFLKKLVSRHEHKKPLHPQKPD
jgi:hypothetical protein